MSIEWFGRVYAQMQTLRSNRSMTQGTSLWCCFFSRGGVGGTLSGIAIYNCGHAVPPKVVAAEVEIFILVWGSRQGGDPCGKRSE